MEHEVRSIGRPMPCLVSGGDASVFKKNTSLPVTTI